MDTEGTEEETEEIGEEEERAARQKQATGKGKGRRHSLTHSQPYTMGLAHIQISDGQPMNMPVNLTTIPQMLHRAGLIVCLCV